MTTRLFRFDNQIDGTWIFVVSTQRSHEALYQSSFEGATQVTLLASDDTAECDTDVAELFVDTSNG